MIDEEQYAKDLLAKVEATRKSGNPLVRQLWNPRRSWSVDKYGGRVADEKTLQCRAAIVSFLRQRGPHSANQVYTQLVGFGERRMRNAKDWLVTSGEIVPVKEENRRITRYALPRESQQ